MASSSPGRSRGAWVPGREGLGNPRRRLVLVLVVGATLIAVGLRLEEVLRPGHLLGVVQ